MTYQDPWIDGFKRQTSADVKRTRRRLLLGFAMVAVVAGAMIALGGCAVTAVHDPQCDKDGLCRTTFIDAGTGAFDPVSIGSAWKDKNGKLIAVHDDATNSPLTTVLTGTAPAVATVGAAAVPGTQTIKVTR